MRATVIVGMETPGGLAVRGLCHVSAFTSGRNPDYVAFAGEKGTLHLTGFPWPHKLEYARAGSSEWTEVHMAPGQDSADPVQHGWDRLAAAFLMDVRGTGESTYPTFRDGYLANQVIDHVRSVNTERWAPEP